MAFGSGVYSTASELGSAGGTEFRPAIGHAALASAQLPVVARVLAPRVGAVCPQCAYAMVQARVLESTVVLGSSKPIGKRPVRPAALRPPPRGRDGASPGCAAGAV